ncbi:single-stranded DNA-binding protein [Staphylococcus saprophyticus]|uniref:Single-stranded DNA-binding protein n=1 Tax=Staphylococcus saprophyticus TaxID=29385 RepID=A0A380HMA6_STASA|nr:single-stranded DNA-binding protein [Staphylococcus saprophyticus]SUM82646.1 single-stranded DNA-binding protein [Staphylococcus saprophyticus]
MPNVFVFTGRITKDLEVKEVSNNLKVLNFSLAVDNPYKKDDVSFFDIVAFGNKAENTAKFCGKGSKVAVDGTVKQERFTDKEGNNRSVVRFNANNIEFLDNKSQSNEQSQQNVSKGQQTGTNKQQPRNDNPFANGGADISEDSLPF